MLVSVDDRGRVTCPVNLNPARRVSGDECMVAMVFLIILLDVVAEVGEYMRGLLFTICTAVLHVLSP